VAILAKRDIRPAPQKKHFYLLQGMLYLETRTGEERKLTCSRPNLTRTHNGVSYYCIPGSALNYPCALIDQQVAQHLIDCGIDR
jgi:hypothetical protein